MPSIIAAKGQRNASKPSRPVSCLLQLRYQILINCIQPILKECSVPNLENSFLLSKASRSQNKLEAEAAKQAKLKLVHLLAHAPTFQVNFTLEELQAGPKNVAHNLAQLEHECKTTFQQTPILFFSTLWRDRNGTLIRAYLGYRLESVCFQNQTCLSTC